MAKYAADRVRNVSVVWLAGTVGCAECHDHKFDPYSTRDFYSLAAFFADLKEIPVVVLTTSDRDEDVARCYQYGANSYLTKPVQFDECVKLVADIQQYWLEVSKLPPR